MSLAFGNDLCDCSGKCIHESVFSKVCSRNCILFILKLSIPISRPAASIIQLHRLQFDQQVFISIYNPFCDITSKSLENFPLSTDTPVSSNTWRRNRIEGSLELLSLPPAHRKFVPPVPLVSGNRAFIRLSGLHGLSQIFW